MTLVPQGNILKELVLLHCSIKQNPRLISFDEKVTSTIIKNEYDFYRPFGKETPLVNGLYSNLLYLIQVRKLLETYKEKAIKSGIIKIGKGRISYRPY